MGLRGGLARLGASVGNTFESFTPSEASHFVAESIVSWITSDASKLSPLLGRPHHIAAELKTVPVLASPLSPGFFGDESIVPFLFSYVVPLPLFTFDCPNAPTIANVDVSMHQQLNQTNWRSRDFFKWSECLL